MFLQLVLLMSEKDDADKGFGRYSLVWEAKCWNVTSASTQKSFIRNSRDRVGLMGANVVYCMANADVFQFRPAQTAFCPACFVIEFIG